MRIYHGSLEIVPNPEIRTAQRTLDYGDGFYTTSSYDQAEAWTRRRMRDAQVDRGYVNVYEFSLEAAGDLDMLRFPAPSAEWVDFVMKNRTEKGFTHSHDIVYGPVANDKVYASFALFEAGILGVDDLIKELRTYRLVDQYLFHTQAAINLIKFIEAKEVEG